MAAIAPDDLRILMRTFKAVFPHASLWYMNQIFTTFGILIGTPELLQIDLTRVERMLKNPAIVGDLQKVNVENALQFVHLLQLATRELISMLEKGRCIQMTSLFWIIRPLCVLPVFPNVCPEPF